MHVETKTLPDSVRESLRSVGYAKADIAVEQVTKVSPFDAGGQGRRAFMVLLDLATGRQEVHRGSWGGGNMFNPQNAVDNDEAAYHIPEGGAVIKGSTGYGGVCATLYLHPANVAKLLPAPTDELTEQERKIMYAFGCIKPGEYRQSELKRAGATEPEIASLVERGYLKQAANGARQITTKGKNTRRASAGCSRW